LTLEKNDLETFSSAIKVNKVKKYFPDARSAMGRKYQGVERQGRYHRQCRL
jgi:hypothetical protein